MAYTKKKEYVIFGKVGNSKYEQLLVSEHANISSLKEAKQIVEYLETKKNCKQCRIVILDGYEIPNFTKTINKKNIK
jgi:hypothetical protein